MEIIKLKKGGKKNEVEKKRKGNLSGISSSINVGSGKHSPGTGKTPRLSLVVAYQCGCGRGLAL